MGASWRPGAAALLLVLAAALVPPAAMAGSAAAPELSDPAGDQAVDAGPLVLGGFNDDAMDDVDLVAAWLEERTIDCTGEAAGTCPRVTLVVQTTAGWRPDGTMTVGFAVKKGPASLPQSTATEAGTAFTLTVAGTTVTGIDNATAVSGADGLRISLPMPKLGATGGDLLTGLAISTSRFSDGTLQDVDADDQTGTDTAGPGTDYTFARPAVNPRILLDVVSVDGRPGSRPPAREGTAPFPVIVRITNLGADADRVVAAMSLMARGADGKTAEVLADLADPAAGDLLGPGEDLERTFTVTPPALEGLTTMDLSFLARSERGAQASAQVPVTFAQAPTPPPAEREVKPAGLTFLTGAAESAGFDDAFGSYAELALLALLVLLVLLAIYLLLALGRTTLDDGPAPEAAWPDEAPARGRGGGVAVGPGGIAETVRASDAAPPALFPDAPPAEGAAEPEPEIDAAALAAALAPEPVKEAAAPLPVATGASSPKIRIEEVRHTPTEPDAGQPVTTEVLLRNEGPTASLRVTLSVDGKPAAERTVQVPSRATKAVELPWTAGPGDNRVRIQAFPA